MQEKQREYSMKKTLSMIAALVTLLSFGLVNTLYSKGNTLVVGGEAADRDKLPHIWWNAGAQDYYMSSLLFTDENQNPGKNDLAASREYDENSNTYRFVLRDGVEFHDGTKLTSEDIRWNVRVCLETPRVTPITKNALKSIEGAQDFIDGKVDTISGVSTPDDKTIEFKLGTPNAFFLQGLSLLFIAPKNMLETYEKGKFHLSDFTKNPIGTGPFKIKSRVPRDYTELVAYEKYHLGKPKIERVLMRAFGKEVTNAMRSGELDFAFTNNMDMYTALKDDPKITSYAKDYAYLRFMLFKQDEPWMNRDVRQALMHAIDRPAIVESFFGDKAQTVETNAPPGYWVNPNLEEFEYNPEKAKALLKKAGWDTSKVISLRFYYKDELTRDLMAAIQNYWEQVGVKSNPRLLSGDVTGLINEKRDYDVCYMATGMFEPTDHYGRFLTDFNTGSGYKNPWYDEVHRQSQQALDPELRKLYYYELQRIMQEDRIAQPLYSPKVGVFFNKRIKLPSTMEYNYEVNHNALDIHLWELTN